MKALVSDRFGPPSMLRVEDEPVPTPRPDEVLVGVRASSANPADWHRFTGLPLVIRPVFGVRRPRRRVVGSDVAGVVEAVGSAVTRFAVGDAVFGESSNGGTMAEFAAVAADELARKPESVSFEQAGAVGIAGLTALQGLRDKAKVQPGERVLVNGAAGGVGTFAVQIAKTMGAHVTGVCSTRNVEMVRRLGADVVVDYTMDDFTVTDEPYDVMLNVNGGRSARDVARCLTREGRLIVIGGPKDGRWLAPISSLLAMSLGFLFRSQKAASFTASPNAADLEELAALMAEGAITPEVERTYDFVDAAAAFEYLETGHARSKLVVTI